MEIKSALSWSAVLLWMIVCLVIFNLESQVVDESDKFSTGITEIIVETVEKLFPDMILA